MKIPLLNRKPWPGKAYCTAPFTSLVVDPNKNVRPCCTFDGSLGNLERDSLTDILTGPQWTEVKTQITEGATPAGCVNCYDREKATGWSVRTCQHDPEKAQNDHWRTAITQLEINSSNICNLACTHCSAEFSSRWVQLNDKFGKEVAYHHLTPDHKVHGPNPENMVRQIAALDLRHLEVVRFKGGEPMLNNDVPAVLQHLLDRGLLHDVLVHFVSNGSVVNDKVLDLLHHARAVEMCISIDGMGGLQDYIRPGPSDITRIERFISRVSSIPRLRFLLSISVMAYNVFSLDRISEWWNGFRETRPEQFPRLGFGLHVVHPAYLSVTVLQDATREMLASKYRRLSNADYRCVIQGLTQPFAGVARHNEFVRYTRDMDKVRNADVLQVVPELESEMVLLPVTGPKEGTWSSSVSPGTESQADTFRKGLSLSEAGMYAEALQLYDRYLQTTAVRGKGFRVKVPDPTERPSKGTPYCTAPFTSLVVDPNKNVRPCCTFDGSLGNLERDSLTDILTGPQWTEVKTQITEGATPAGCVNCYDREKATGWSVRTCQHDPEKAQNDHWRTAITQLEINSSNICNLACTHCSAEFSSRWVQLNDKFGKEVAYHHLTPDHKVHGPNPENMVRQIAALDLRHLEVVRFKGGEPMLNNDVPAVLQHLLDRGLLHDVLVHFVSNGSVVNDKVLDLLHHARAVSMCISVDGTGPLQDYIRRGPSDITRIERFISTLSALPRIRFLLSISVMAYNVFSLDRISEWWDGFRSTDPDRFERLEFHLHVLEPPYLSVNALQDRTRQRLIRKYRALSDADYGVVIFTLAQPFAGIAVHNKFVTYTRDMDRAWNSDVLQVVPDLEPEMVLLEPPGFAADAWQRVHSAIRGVLSPRP